MDELRIRELIDEAIDALNAGDYVRAVGIGDQLASIAPDSAVVPAIRAQALLGTDASEESFEEANRAVELAPRDHHARQLLAMAAWRTGRLRVAQESYQRAIELSDRAPSLLADYAWFMATERGPKLGEDAAREAIDADPQAATAWAALGMAQFRMHRRDEAHKSMAEALRLNPNDIYAQSAMVSLLQDQHNDAQAEALADLLKEHAGTEEMVAAVRREAKQRRVSRMLVERNTNPEDAVSERRSYAWIWLLGGGALVSMLMFMIDARLSYITIGCVVILLIVLRKWLD